MPDDLKAITEAKLLSKDVIIKTLNWEKTKHTNNDFTVLFTIVLILF